MLVLLADIIHICFVEAWQIKNASHNHQFGACCFICIGAFEKKLASTLLGHFCFCTMGPTKKELQLGLPFIPSDQVSAAHDS